MERSLIVLLNVFIWICKIKVPDGAHLETSMLLLIMLWPPLCCVLAIVSSGPLGGGSST